MGVTTPRGRPVRSQNAQFELAYAFVTFFKFKNSTNELSHEQSGARARHEANVCLTQVTAIAFEDIAVRSIIGLAFC